MEQKIPEIPKNILDYIRKKAYATGEWQPKFEQGAIFGYHLRDAEVQTLQIEKDWRDTMIETLKKELNAHGISI